MGHLLVVMGTSVVFQEVGISSCPVQGGQDWLGPLTSTLRLRRYPVNDLMMSEDWKLYHQITLSTSSFEHVSHEEACNPDKPLGNMMTNHLSPHLRPPASLSHKYLKPLTFEDIDLKLVLCFLLGCLANKLFLCYRLWHLRVWLTVSSKRAWFVNNVVSRTFRGVHNSALWVT